MFKLKTRALDSIGVPDNTKLPVQLIDAIVRTQLKDKNDTKTIKNPTSTGNPEIVVTAALKETVRHMRPTGKRHSGEPVKQVGTTLKI